jgi:hypothetical protein
MVDSPKRADATDRGKHAEVGGHEGSLASTFDGDSLPHSVDYGLGSPLALSAPLPLVAIGAPAHPSLRESLAPPPPQRRVF